ncbi:MAG: acyl-CoA thioesterase [Solirubrobacteraceae bacterium]
MDSLINIDKYKFSTKLQLRYEEFDTFFHLNNIAFLSCCQYGRDIFFKTNLPLFNWGETPFVVASNLINYHKEILLGVSEVKIYVRLSEIGNKSITIEHLIVSTNVKNKEQEINCYNKAVLVRLDVKTRKSILIEDYLRNDFNKLIN